MLPTARAADFAARFSQPYVPGEDWKYKERPNSAETPIATGECQPLSEDEIASFEGSIPTQEPQYPPTLLKDGKFGRIPVYANESTDDLPSIQEEVMFRLYCTPTRNIPVQDHEIWVAKVDSIEYPPHGDIPFGLEPYAPLSLLYGDRHFRETGLHMVGDHCKIRRWVRRKMLYEFEKKQEKKEKLERRLRLSQRRRDLQDMRGDFPDELLEHLDLEGGGEVGRELEPETREEDEHGVGSADEWFNVMKKRAGLKKMLPTLPPDIVPLDNPHPNSFRHADNLGVPDKSHGANKPQNSDTPCHPPINPSSPAQAPATPTQNSSSSDMSGKTLATGKVSQKPMVRSLEDWMKKRPSHDPVCTYLPHLLIHIYSD